MVIVYWLLCTAVTAGIEDYCSRYGASINRVLSTMGPPLSMSPDTEAVRRISAAMGERIPLDQLYDRRQWRKDRLLALAKVKKQLDGQ